MAFDISLNTVSRVIDLTLQTLRRRPAVAVVALLCTTAGLFFGSSAHASSTTARHAAVVAAGATTLPPDLPAPSSLKVSLKDQHVFLSWSPVKGATRYLVTRDGLPVTRTSWTFAFDIDKATTTGTFEYSVQAVTSSGVAGQAVTKSVTATPPTPPMLVTSSVRTRSVSITVLINADTDTWQLLRNGSAIGIYPASRTTVTVTQQPGLAAYAFRSVSRTGAAQTGTQLYVTMPR